MDLALTLNVFDPAYLKSVKPENKDITIIPKHKIICQLVTLTKNPQSLNDYLAHLMHKDIAGRKWQHAIEIATQAGLDGEKVANILVAFVQTTKTVR